MAAPVVSDVTTSGANNADRTKVFNYPTTVNAGDLLYAIAGEGHLLGGVHCWHDEGWYCIGSIDGMSVAFKHADGTEGGGTFEVGIGPTVGRGVCHVHRITGHSTDDIPVEVHSSIPPNYRGLSSQVNGTALGLHIAERDFEGSSEDPSAFGFDSSFAGGAFTISVPPSGAAFPVTAGRAATTLVGQTSHAINVPSGLSSGDLLIAAFVRDGTTDDITVPSGWTVFATITGSADICKLAWRKADAVDDSLTITTTASVRSVALVYHITGAADPTVTPPEASTTTATGASHDPPSLTPAGGSAKYLWLAGCFINDREKLTVSGGAAGLSANPDPPSKTFDGGAEDYLAFAIAAMQNAEDASGFPTGYSNTATNNLFGIGLATASKQLSAAASEDPGTFTWATSDDWEALTGAVYPAAATAGEGFAKLQGAPRASVQGEHEGDGNVTLKDAPTMLAWTEKSGAGFALAFDADLGINRTQLAETGEGFGLMRSYPTLISLGQKDGESEITGFGGPILLGQGEKAGEGFGLDRDASFLLALAEKGGAGEGLSSDHPYLIGHGFKKAFFGLVRGHGRALAEYAKAGTGSALTVAHVRVLAHAVKATSGHGLARDLTHALARSLKSGQGLALMDDEAFLAALGVKAVGSHVLLLDAPYLLADGGAFENVTLLPPQIVDVPARVWVVDVE